MKYSGWFYNTDTGQWELWDRGVELALARSSTVVVAASNASPSSRQWSDHPCDGTADEEQINEAIGTLPS